MNAPALNPAAAWPFPSRTQELPEAQRGLYDKFSVSRADCQDAPGGKHENDKYFVLNITTDKHAIPALAAYAESCKAERPVLACDLGKIVSDYVTKDDEYVLVPETELPNGVIVPAFTCAKYIASQGANNTPISVANQAPWVNINYHESNRVAALAGLEIITETQWLAIAYQISQQADNWTSGTVGEGSLYQGLHLGTVSEAQAATYESPKAEERRWHVLSNGERIYDFSGNAFQWVYDDLHGADQGLIGDDGIAQDSPSITLAPAKSMEQGTGWRPDDASGWSGRALVRGGCWGSSAYAGVFHLYYGWPRSEYDRVGFRCTKSGL